ncbi:MAG: ester cyclase [Polyangiaceae bacterium]
MHASKEDVIRRYFGELFGEGRLALVDELLHPDYVNHSPSPGLPPGRVGVRVVVAALRSAFPDLSYAIEDLVIGADAVATRTVMRGTHRGDFFGLPPTGRTIAVPQMTIERFAEGRIVAHHRLTDEASLMRQLSS